MHQTSSDYYSHIRAFFLDKTKEGEGGYMTIRYQKRDQTEDRQYTQLL